MNYKTKLTDLLKTVKEIREDIEELQFGTYVEISNRLTRIIWENINWTFAVRITSNWRVVSKRFDRQQFKIIWNPLEERMLRMYCEKNNIIFWIDEKWRLYYW